ncbi:hypothetical protein GCK72_000057 [Caenorhabditis remanei]|uniref:F-box domain-containing protein n=1 Tax=Caenorhabditis remanei TaxID=31234 RepID=A0A6A5HL31_CAERE|nr:hypothetical protein GCK72_000057 [Caenorhabditis remanei]KAF1768245.1 hypothetical protein GCK72_000057 [Caenorhabditis remanei]
MVVLTELEKKYLVFEHLNLSQYLDIKDRISLRNVSKRIRLIVDSWDPKLTEVFYQQCNSWRFISESFNSVIKAEDLSASVLSILKHPKLRLEKLKLYRQDNQWDAVSTELNRTDSKLSIRKFELMNNNSKYIITSNFLNLEVLEEVSLCITNETKTEIHKILHSDQCKALQMLTVNSYMNPNTFPFKCFNICPRLNLQFHGVSADNKIAYVIKNIVRRALIEIWYISNDVNPFNITFMQQSFRREDTLIKGYPNFRHYLIPETEEYYEIEMEKECIRVEWMR